jgi:hypothetical protein
MSFDFTPAPQPFPRWWGPYTPATGNHSGFRFHRGTLGTWVGDAFWTVRRSRGVELLERVVRQRWGGGRVLLLPNGLVVKPLQEQDQRGIREYIGLIKGDVILVTPDGDEFTLRNPVGLRPGGAWQGPRSTGLSCVLQANGSLKCEWHHPDGDGSINQTLQLTSPNAAFAKTFRALRGTPAGAVRVTANGAVITSWQDRGQWKCHYIGHINFAEWPHLEEWIEWRTTAEPEHRVFDSLPDLRHTAAPADVEDEDEDSHDDEESDFDYPYDPTEDIYDDYIPPPEMEEEEDEAEEEDEDEGEDSPDQEDLGEQQESFAEREKLLSCIDFPGSGLANPLETGNRQHADAKPKHPPAPTGFWNWVVKKLKGQS